MQEVHVPHPMPTERDSIAVVGMACRYPGARDLPELWQNILARRRQFRRIPEVRLPLSEYHDADPSVPDKTYGSRAAVIDGYEFDWQKRFVPKLTYETADIAHWLALDTALAALTDAGLTRQTVARDKTGVVLGNTLTGEHTRAQTMRQRWPFVRKALRAAAQARGMAPTQVRALEATMQDYFQSVFAPTTEDSLSGGLSNTIAGRICNVLDLHGGGYTVDGACSSSLIAVATAANALVQGDMDLVLAGGVDISLDTFELIGFAKTGALTRDEMRVYDRRASGFTPGEGCGFVALKRLADARAAGDRVYAVLRGWGISSDGKGGLTAPNREGQATALRRAYARAGYEARSVHFFEGHGTGTPVGDRTEVEGISLAVGAPASDGLRTQGITSFKSLVGHTKAAAGVGGFIKAVLAVNRRVMPPTCGCQEPHTVFAEQARGLYPILQGEQHAADTVLRAGVSAMGFGGINCHVTLESGDAPQPELVGALDEQALMAHVQDSELFVFAAPTGPGLQHRLNEAAALAEGISLAEMADLAAKLGAEQQPGLWRAAVIANTPEDLQERLRELRQTLAQSAPGVGTVWSNAAGDAWLSQADHAARLGFVFPGQGSQQLQMAHVLVARHAWARELLARCEQWLQEVSGPSVAAAVFVPLERAFGTGQPEAWAKTLARTEIAQPAICLASLLWLRHLQHLGLQPATVAGHSLGELTAFHAAGAFDEETLIKLAALRGQAMAAPADAAGGMASLGCDAATATRLIAQTDGYLTVANLNSPRQTVVSGATAAVAQVVALAMAEGLGAKVLPVSNAFHSDFVAGAAALLQAKARVPLQPLALSARLVSGVHGQMVGSDLSLREHFANQITAPVDFVAVAQRLAENTDLLVEVGPGRVLSGLLSDTLGHDLCAPVASRVGRHVDLHRVLARAHCAGHALHWAELFRDRLIRPFTPTASKRFIDNPCERPFRPTQDWSAQPPIGVAEVSPNTDALASLGLDTAELQAYLTQRGSFIAQVIRADLGTPALPVPVSPAMAPASPNGAAPAVITAKVETAASSAQLSGIGISIGIEARLLAQVAERTGFAVDSLSLDMRLLDDLNLDSIKAGEFVAAAAMSLGVADQIDASLFANASLQEVAHALRAVQADGASEALVAVAASAPMVIEHQASQRDASPAVIDSQAIEGQLLDLVAQRTGFDRAGLNPSLRLLDDLNLDSIKAGELVAAAAQSLGLAGEIDASLFANASVEEIARALVALLDKGASAAAVIPEPASMPAAVPVPVVAPTRAAPAPTPGWVRCFAMVPSDEPLEDLAPGWKQAYVLVLHEEDTQAHAEAVRTGLLAAGARVLCLPFAVARVRHSVADDTFTHRVALLPRTNGNDGLADCVTRLQDFGHAPRATAGKPGGLALVQFHSGPAAEPVGLARGGAAAFAASVHLERSDLRVRVLEADARIAPQALAAALIGECTTAQAFNRVRLDADGRRHVLRPQVLEAGQWPGRRIVWGPDDVVVVTGGARGITAECALAFAQATGVRMALIGRSAPDAEIETTLERFATAGCVATYLSCDVANATAVETMLATVRTELGAVTGLIHGAAVNQPRRVEQVSVEAALTEIGPKLQGALNLLRGMQDAPPKLIVGLSSIIGVSGMAGNAWYAYSNESLHLALCRFRAAHPQTQIVSMAYSVWSEVGMGARLGSTHALARMGIDAIPPDQGVARFLQLALTDPGATEVVVAARLGGLDTWQAAVPPKPAADRYLDDVQAFVPGVELRVRTRLSMARDPYVGDHIYKGSALFPTVFGLEAMAQAAAWVTGRQSLDTLVIEDIILDRPIVVDQKQGTVIELRAQVMERDTAGGPQCVKVGIATEATGFVREHFAARFLLDADLAPTHEQWTLPAEPLAIEPKADLYSWLLFQGPRFQRLRRVHVLNSLRHLFEAEARGSAALKSDDGQTYLLGDPYFRDALLQAPQLTVSQQLSLPVHIDRIELRVCPLEAPTLRLAEALYKGWAPDHARHLVSEVTAVDQDGQVLERLSGYRLAVLEYLPDHPTPEQIAAPDAYDTEDLQQRLGAAAVSLGCKAPAVSLACGTWHAMDRETRHRAQLPLLEAVLAVVGSRQTRVDWAEDRRPWVPGDDSIGVSVSHDDRLCLVVAGSGPQGCDLAPVVQRKDLADWLALVGHERAPLLEALMVSGEGLDVAGTRLWAAAEALRKAGGGVRLDLRMGTRQDDAVVLSGLNAQGERLTVLTLLWRAVRGPLRVVAVLSMSDVPAQVAAATATTMPLATLATLARGSVSPGQPTGYDHGVYSATVGDGPQGQMAYTLRFPLGFRETATLSRHLYFSHYFAWMGKLREAACQPVYDELVAEFSTGRWGMVTNRSETMIMGAVGACDLIEGRMWLDQLYGPATSTMDLCYDWTAVAPDGARKLVARSKMTASWVEILDHGVVQARPFPPYYQAFVERMVPPPGSTVGHWNVGQHASPGPVVQACPTGPGARVVLREQCFETSLEDANLVGNLYFANYYGWQGRVVDQYFHSLAPELFRGTGESGELRCVYSKVDHLREAMPFETIKVRMSLASVHEHGVRLLFDYYRVMPGGELHKLAWGEHVAQWVKAGTDGVWRERALPASVRLELSRIGVPG